MQKNYFLYSRSPLYGLLSIAPLILLYEGFIFFSGLNSYHSRHEADTILKLFFQMFGIHGPIALGILLFMVIGIAIFLHKDETPIKFRYFFLIIIESVIYATILGFLLKSISDIFLMILPPISQDVKMKIGIQNQNGVTEKLPIKQ